MKNSWWRAYDDDLHDARIQKLEPELFRAWFNILCLACGSNGTLPPVEDVAFHLRYRREEALETLDALRRAGLIDETEQGLKPHNWGIRQYKSDVSTQRVREHRERKEAKTETEIPRAPKVDRPQTGYADAQQELSGEGPLILNGLGVEGDKAKRMIGRWLKGTSDNHEAVLGALRAAEQAAPVDPIPWIARALTKYVMGARNGSIADANRAALARVAAKLQPSPPHGGDFDSGPGKRD